MDSALIDETSEQFLGQWQRLVSTTNWDKGRIVHQWRSALEASEADGGEVSDEAWSRRVGNVTPQHVGRLRRVFERFGEVRGDYEGLYWSHFQAAIDWHDAEMWLEGAVQNGWSVAHMRRQRWEALAGPDELKPREDEVLSSEWDEDADAADDETDPLASRHLLAVVHAPGSEDDEQAALDEDHADRAASRSARGPRETAARNGAARPAAELVRPFANLPELPGDVSDAFEAYKLCILRHKLSGWREIARDDLLASLDALKELALAPAAE